MKEEFWTCTNATVVPVFKYGLLMQLMVMTAKADKTPLGSPVEPTVSGRKDSTPHLLDSETTTFLPSLS